MHPKPVQSPLPVYIGGNNENAVRRAAIYGQGWMGAGLPSDQIHQMVSRLKAIATKNDRDPGSIDIAPQFAACIDDSYELAIDRFRNSQMYKHLFSLKTSTLKDQVKAGAKFEDTHLIGDSQLIVERVEGLRQGGVTHLCGILFTANSVAEYKDQMQRFAEAVIPHFR